MDAHDAVRDMVHVATGILYARKPIKETNFGILYGMGILALAKKTGLPEDETKALKAAIKAAIPGLKSIDKVLKKLNKMNEPYVTWGGRFYWTEPDKIVQGRMRNFGYKDLNTLIQSSAADATKEAMILVDEACDKSRLSLQVYDQLVINTPRGHEKSEMVKMRDAMESLECDVPMLSEGEIGRKNWGDLKPFEPKRIVTSWS
jgi:DNA polymerase I-like protein with 3'-5' exonuclease and polymerase domains